MELKDIEANVKAVNPEEMSLKALIEAGKRAQYSYTQLSRSSFEIGGYNMKGCVRNYTEVCDEAIELKIKLAGVLFDQANCYLSLMQTIDEEIAKRLETLDK